ncbi:MAG: 23S rRNA (guanosine(2251)-2'-O)-methyltransferase RlmB [Actinobacteria bacterium]|nr:23S rRNA (guanosine(2251)-2'-O)-methyltransferase RlmB [Actinomycetota bacterium]
MILIKGHHAIEAAIKSKTPIQRLIITHQYQAHYRDLIRQAERANIPIQAVTSDQLRKQYKESNTQSALALVSDVKHMDFDEIKDHPDQHPGILILDHLEDPFNFGAILRSAAGMGVKTVIYPKARQAAINAGVIKASSGAIYFQNLIKVSNLSNAINTLKKLGYWIYGTDVHQGQDLRTCPTHHPFVLIVGNEHKGMSKGLKKWVDVPINISLDRQVESLNVSVATGIILYELMKGRP